MPRDDQMELNFPKGLTIYLSGPMTGLPEYNAPEFKRHADYWRSKGYTVLSPPELDNGDHTRDWSYYIRRDLRLLLSDVDRVYLLDGWEKSRGARLEVTVAKAIGIPLHWAEDGTMADVETESTVIYE